MSVYVCEHPECLDFAINAVGGIWFCASHEDWAVQIADGREIDDDNNVRTL